VTCWKCWRATKPPRGRPWNACYPSCGECQSSVLSQMLILCSNENLKVVESAVQTLRWISRLSEGAQAAVDANVLECVPKLLDSPSQKVRKWTWSILGELTRHESTAKAATRYLLSLLRRVSIPFSRARC
jgi:hypothetical protein